MKKSKCHQIFSYTSLIYIFINMYKFTAHYLIAIHLQNFLNTICNYGNFTHHLFSTSIYTNYTNLNLTFSIKIIFLLTLIHVPKITWHKSIYMYILVNGTCMMYTVNRVSLHHLQRGCYIPMYIHHLTTLRAYVALQNLKFYSVTKERDFLTYMEDPCRR